MKRFFVFFLALSLCLALCACGKKTDSDTTGNTISSTGTVENDSTIESTGTTAGSTGTAEDDETTESTGTAAGETENSAEVEATSSNEPDDADYTEVKLDLTAQTQLYKTFGRTYLNENGLNVDYGGNGIEFEAECSGDITLHYYSSAKTYLQVFVDGQPGSRIVAGIDSEEVIVAKNLKSGLHTIRVIRDSDLDTKGSVLGLTGVSFIGKAETIKAPAQKDLYIEFVGDSITAGKYTASGSGNAIHKATNSYAYLTADALNADFSLVARGGCGYFRVQTCPKTMNQLYQYYNIFSKVYKEKYTPTRQADVVILALGTNDGQSNVEESYEKGTVPFATFEEALKDQIRLIREMHGSDVKIVLLYNMMSSSWEEEFKKVSQEENTYILKTTQNREGGNNHPSAAGHKTIANELIAYMKDVVLK